MLQAIERRPLPLGCRTCQQIDRKCADQPLPAFRGGGKDGLNLFYLGIQWEPPFVFCYVTGPFFASIQRNDTGSPSSLSTRVSVSTSAKPARLTRSRFVRAS